MASTNPKLETGLNQPVETLPDAKYYTTGTDGMVVYLWPDGTMSIKENTKFRYQDISEMVNTMKNFRTFLEEGFTGVFLITLSEALILNMDSLQKVYHTVILLGVFDKTQTFIGAQEVETLHSKCSFSTRAEALACEDVSQVHILPKLNNDQAVSLFNQNQDIICHNPGKHPERWFNQAHLNARNAMSGCRTPYECFIRFLLKLFESVDKYDTEMITLCKTNVVVAVKELRSIQCQTNWQSLADKFVSDVDKLMKFKKSYQDQRKLKSKDPVCIKQDKHGEKKEYPPKFLETYKLKIPNRGFLGKLFFNHASTFRLLNKISQYTIQSN